MSAQRKCHNCDGAVGIKARFCKDCGEDLTGKLSTDEEVSTFNESVIDELENPEQIVFPESEEEVDVEITVEPETDSTEVNETPKPLTYVLCAISGPGKGKVFSVSKGTPLVLGKDATLNGAIPDPYMSKEHAVIEVDDIGIQVTDSDSTNGTFIQLQGTCSLQSGDYIRVGRTVLAVEIEE